MSVIVAGAGAIGFSVPATLAKQGRKVVVIEQDAERCRVVSDEYIGQVIHGDATHPEVFEQADPHEREVAVAVTGTLGVDVVVCSLAKRFGGLRTILRGSSDELSSEDQDDVDTVVYPERLGANGVVNAVTGEDYRIIADTEGGLSVLEVRIGTGAPVAGKRLETVRLPFGASIFANFTAGQRPDHESILEPGETYGLVCESSDQDELLGLLID